MVLRPAMCNHNRPVAQFKLTTTTRNNTPLLALSCDQGENQSIGTTASRAYGTRSTRGYAGHDDVFVSGPVKQAPTVRRYGPQQLQRTSAARAKSSCGQAALQSKEDPCA